MVVVMVRIQMMALLCSALLEAAVSYEEEHIGILELKNAFFVSVS